MWEPGLWLPRNVSWQDVPPRFDHLKYPILAAVPLTCIRILYEAFVGIPLGYFLGYGSGTLYERIRHHLFFGFAKNSKSKKVLESFYRFSFYTFIFIYGFVTLKDEPWFYDVRLCWIDYPRHPIPNTVWWYYMSEMSFYCSLVVSSLFDSHRRDFWQMFVHHLVTIGLISISWTINFVRVGTLVLVSHDISDVILEFSKLIRYDKKLAKKYINALFIVFITSWTLTRIGYFPFFIIRSAIFDAPQLIQPDYNLLNISQPPYAPRLIIGLLFCLLGLHLFWTAIIFRIVIRTVTEGEAKDVRSDDEEEENENEEERKLNEDSTREADECKVRKRNRS
ncbi:hypothetical protein AB6A40_002533 [Gnathostoma spinigerum]|uniref:TLC domain-containing protein n=1 Tax=Gnathostoma spinigerum TaxID=75299 RepID=A0ABD6E6U8_9BILA